jgi:ABC-type branched-subunit amino acid transport system ATPase component
MKQYKRARIEIGRSYQVTSIFPELTVRENVRVAVQPREGHNYKRVKSSFDSIYIIALVLLFTDL